MMTGYTEYEAGRVKAHKLNWKEKGSRVVEDRECLTDEGKAGHRWFSPRSLLSDLVSLARLPH